MPRKKKESEPEFVTTGLRDNLVKISIRTGVALEDLRKLNPSIRFPITMIGLNQKVRIR